MAWNNPYIEKLENYRDIILDVGEKPCWAEIFSTPEPQIVLDLGSGAGNFVRQLSERYPKRCFVGLELRYKRLIKTSEKLKKRSISNVRLLQKNAENIDSLFVEKSLFGVHVNFPDPWAKPKQKKHRLLSEVFLKKLKKLLIKEGYFSFKTDHQEYFKFVHDLILKQGIFDIIEYSEDLHGSIFQEDNYFTEFELLFKNQGLPVYHLRAVPKKDEVYED